MVSPLPLLCTMHHARTKNQMKNIKLSRVSLINWILSSSSSMVQHGVDRLIELVVDRSIKFNQTA